MLMTSEAAEATWWWEIHLQFIGSWFDSRNCNVGDYVLIYFGFKINYNLLTIYYRVKQMNEYTSSVGVDETITK